jgi:hypothetical protein
MNLPVIIVGLSTMKVVGAWPCRSIATPPARSSAAPIATDRIAFTVGPPDWMFGGEIFAGSTENTGSLSGRASATRPGG